MNNLDEFQEIKIKNLATFALVSFVQDVFLNFVASRPHI